MEVVGGIEKQMGKAKQKIRHTTLLLESIAASIPTSMNENKSLRMLLVMSSNSTNGSDSAWFFGLTCLRTLNLSGVRLKHYRKTLISYYILDISTCPLVL